MAELPDPTRSVVIAIGNSDNGLTQQRWADYAHDVRELVRSASVVVHGEWYSRPDSPYQNAGFSFEVEDDEQTVRWLKSAMRGTARRYEQDSVAWLEGQTELLTT